MVGVIIKTGVAVEELPRRRLIAFHKRVLWRGSRRGAVVLWSNWVT